MAVAKLFPEKKVEPKVKPAAPKAPVASKPVEPPKAPEAKKN